MSSSGKSQFYAETAHRFADCCLHTLAQWSSLRTSKARQGLHQLCLPVCKVTAHDCFRCLLSPAGRNMWDSHGLKSAGTNSGLEPSVHRYKNLILDQANWFFVCCSTWCGAIMSHKHTILWLCLHPLYALIHTTVIEVVVVELMHKHIQPSSCLDDV